MNINNIPIDLSDIPEVTDFSKAQRNPHIAEKIRKYGYSVTIHYSPEYVAETTRQNIEKIQGMDMSDLDEDERAAFKRYIESHKEYVTD